MGGLSKSYVIGCVLLRIKPKKIQCSCALDVEGPNLPILLGGVPWWFVDLPDLPLPLKERHNGLSAKRILSKYL